MRQRAPSSIANFDSASAMLRAASNYLSGSDFPAVGQSPMLKPLARAVNLLPRRAQEQEQVYAFGGLAAAISPNQLDRVSAERIAAWATARYPARRYPAAMIGSSNGAAVHLCAALGIPWLPQTVLIPVRQFDVNPDELKQALDKSRQ